MSIADIVLSRPFLVSVVQWTILPVLPTLAILWTRERAGHWNAKVVDAVVLLVVLPLGFVVPVWLFDLRPLKGEQWTAYLAGCCLGGVVSIWIRSRLRSRIFQR
jgi:hypothetical protein